MQDARQIRFATTLSKLAAACRQELDDLTLEVYTEAVCPLVDPAEWDEFVLAAIRTGRFTWFPKVAELVDALREFRGAAPLDAEAVQAYERVIASSTYLPEAGARWVYRDVVERCGKAAAEAFLAAGGDEAFRSEYRSQERRAAFLAAYQRAAREQPETRLLPAPTAVPQLPAGTPELSAGEAKPLLDRVREKAGETARPVAIEPYRPLTEREHARRLEQLKAQAQEITAEEERPQEQSA